MNQSTASTASTYGQEVRDIYETFSTSLQDILENFQDYDVDVEQLGILAAYLERFERVISRTLWLLSNETRKKLSIRGVRFPTCANDAPFVPVRPRKGGLAVRLKMP